MSNQAPAKVGSSAPAASNTNTSSNNKTLLNDPTFKAIHNAFLLGWNLMELKSRIQTVACILSLPRDAVIHALEKQLTSTQLDSQSQSQAAAQTQPQADQKNLSTSTPVNSPPQSLPVAQSQSPANQNNPPASTPVNSPAPSQPQNDQNNLSDSIDSLLENVVLKDVIAWKDLKKQQDQSNMPPSQEKSLSSELRDNIWLTSVLRAIFIQIATLHVKRFPNSDVTNTIYDIRPPSPNNQPVTDQAFPFYLYPTDPKFDYANVGIRTIKQDDIGNNNTDIDSFVKNFRLYDVTRRALNCLTLLLTTPGDSLMPRTIEGYQQELTQQALNPGNQQPANKQGWTRWLTLFGALSNNQKPANQPAGTHDRTDQDKKKAIKKLSNLIIPLLEAWDSFLRESFYVDTNSQNDNPDSSSYEIELVAYEAGRSLAALSWGVSVALAPLENLENIDRLLRIEDEQAKEVGPHTLKDVLTKKVQNTWLNVFNDRDVNHVQHQIAALSTALDEAFYRVHTDVKPPKPDDPLASPNPDLPSQAIQAVNHSLDYWERAIARLSMQNKPLLKPLSTTTQIHASTPAPVQKESWFSTQRKKLIAFFRGDATDNEEDDTSTSSNQLNWQTSKTLRMELIQQATVWQSLVLCQQGLSSFTVETVTQKILNDFMQQLETAAGNEIFNSGAFKWTLGIIIGIILVLIGLIGLVTLVLRPSSSILMSIMSIINSPPVIITTIVTAIGAIATPFVNGFLGKLSKIGSFFGSAGTAVETALQDGYEQILIEFGYLNHNIGVTFPLIEFFVWEEIKFGDNPIEDGYDFLVNVFWTAQNREEEIQRVARAAFGPIGTFVGASLKLGDNGSQKTSSPSKNGSKQSVQQSKSPSPTGNPGKSKQPVSNVPSVPSVSNREDGSSI